jgi:hypothetical protein
MNGEDKDKKKSSNGEDTKKTKDAKVESGKKCPSTYLDMSVILNNILHFLK